MNKCEGKDAQRKRCGEYRIGRMVALRKMNEFFQIVLPFDGECGKMKEPNKPNIDEYTVIRPREQYTLLALTFEFAKNATPQVRAQGDTVIARFLIWFVWRQSELRFSVR